MRKESVVQGVSIDRDGYSQSVAANRALILLSRNHVCLALTEFALNRLPSVSSHVLRITRSHQRRAEGLYYTSRWDRN
jgi:hypothetical protein